VVVVVVMAAAAAVVVVVVVVGQQRHQRHQQHHHPRHYLVAQAPSSPLVGHQFEGSTALATAQVQWPLKPGSKQCGTSNW
jgi:hypothetical protein